MIELQTMGMMVMVHAAPQNCSPIAGLIA